MDRRVKKTRQAIITAFLELLEVKPYEKIRVSELLEAADVGRATFYTHFESKEVLLEEVSLLLFHHLFHEDVNGQSLSEVLQHLFWHIANHRVWKQLLLQSDSALRTEFCYHLEKFLYPVMEKEWTYELEYLPLSFRMQQLSSSVMTSIQWWLKEHSQLSSDTISNYCYEYLIRKGV